MCEKSIFQKWNKDRLRLAAVLLFFGISGICYSHAVQEESLILGTETALEEIGQTDAEIITEGSLSGQVNLNKADREELTRLPGIGEKLAEEIIRYREKNGGFGRIEEIMEISGIGEKTFQEIKEQITVGE